MSKTRIINGIINSIRVDVDGMTAAAPDAGQYRFAIGDNSGVPELKVKDSSDTTYTFLSADGAVTASNLAMFNSSRQVKDSGVAVSTDGTFSSNSDAKLPTEKAVKTYADQLLGAADAMTYKGVVNCSANPDYPAANAGDTYKISVAGKIGGASGTNVDQATVGAYWNIVERNLDGAVTGPSSSTDNTIPRFDSTTGKVIQASSLTISDNNKLTIPDNADEGALNLTERSAAPASPSTGDIYLDDGTNTAAGLPDLRRYTGVAWEDVNADFPSGVQGDILYHNGTSWVVLPAGTSGYYLKTNGAAANPAWSSPAGSGDMLKATYDTDDDGTVDGADLATVAERVRKASTELTISSGSITITQGIHRVDGESDAADDLNTIAGGTNGDIIFLYPENSARNITIKNGAGNIVTGDGNDYTIPDNGFCALLYDGSNWRLLGISGGGLANVLTAMDAETFVYPKTGVTNPFTDAANSVDIEFDVDNYGAEAALLSPAVQNEPMQLPKFTIPTGTTSLKFRLVYEPETGNSWGGETVVWKGEWKNATDNAAWSSATGFTVGTDTVPGSGSNPQVYEATVSLATLGLAAGDVVQMVIYSDTTSSWAHDVAFELCEVAAI